MLTDTELLLFSSLTSIAPIFEPVYTKRGRVAKTRAGVVRQRCCGYTATLAGIPVGGVYRHHNDAEAALNDFIYTGITNGTLPMPRTFMCNVTERTFAAIPVQVTKAGAWANCPYCDAHSRVVGTDGYDATEPQVHALFIASPAAEQQRAA